MKQQDVRDSFGKVLDNLEFYRTVISKEKGRFLRYPFRSLLYVLRNRLTDLRIRVTGNPFFLARTFWGDRMTTVLPVNRSLLYYGILDAAELKVQRAMLQYLHGGDTFLDVGANAGFYSLLGKRLVGEDGRVIAFEPVPSTFLLLEKNTTEKGISIIPEAVSSEEGTVAIHDFGVQKSGLNTIVGSRGTGQEIHSVKAVTLDSFCLLNNVRPDVIKIDVEGAERRVLSGAKRMLERFHPVLLVEISAENIQGVVSFLDRLGYEAREYTDDLKDLVRFSGEKKRADIVFVQKRSP